MPAADRGVLVWVVEHRAAWLDPILIGLSVIGYGGVVWIVLATVLALAGRRAILLPTALTAGSVWAADLIAVVVKSVVDRPRPPSVVPEADPLFGGTLGSSLPSGHAATSFAGAVVLAYLFPRALPWLVILAVAIAFSRVYVGVHYPFDVLAGAVVGASVGALVVWALRVPLKLSEARRPRAVSPPPG
ncbi:MAG: phosphatase PAP2 family protein [Gaiellaceae bacterium]